MKSFRISLKNVATIVACFAVSLMLFTGCEKDDPAPEPDNGIAEIGKTYVSATANAEKVYTLKVSKSLLKSTATATDTYVLLYVDKSGEVKTSTGVVTSSVGESLTLTPTGGTPFTVTVTANGITGISGSITFTDNSTATGGSLTPFANGEIEITGTVITEDRVLGVPGMAINYVYNDVHNRLLEIEKTLTVLPGTTIRFTQPGGGIRVKGGATVKMIGEDKLRELDAAGNLSATPGTKNGHITLKGGATKGSWSEVVIESDTDNQLKYVDFINGGKTHDGVYPGVVELGTGAKLAMQYCKISGSQVYGFTAYGGHHNITAFDHNVIENCDVAPAAVFSFNEVLKFDETSDMTVGNGKPYVLIDRAMYEINTDITINPTSVPYYIVEAFPVYHTLTINAGVTFYMSENGSTFNTQTDADDNSGSIITNGTAARPVIFTRLAGETYYWGYYGGLTFNTNKANSTLNWTIIEYNKDYAIGLSYGGIVTLNNCTIRNNLGLGVHWGSGHCDCVVNHTGSNERFSNNAGGNVELCDGRIVNALP
jgi:hypothetical protein